MSKILSIGTAVPAYKHRQLDILHFMQTIYAATEAEKRKLRFLYQHSGIEHRYSVLPDYSRPATDWKFYPASENLEPFPRLEERMNVYNSKAPQLSVDAIRNCLDAVGVHHRDVTHLITVSCTGMSAPGLDLQVIALMDLQKDIFRTSVNFMGCYAALHALRMAHAICSDNSRAHVLIVCTELCTLHFQKEATTDNLMSSLLFGDGSAAVLVSGDAHERKGVTIESFHSEVLPEGRRDMAWELSSQGFLMTLSSYVPDLIEADLAGVVQRALEKQKLSAGDISTWCMHPGGKRILESISKSLQINSDQLQASYDVLRQYGNLSSAGILFVLKELLQGKLPGDRIFGVAFGPGLTVETFTATAA